MKDFKILKEQWLAFFVQDAPDLINFVQKLFLVFYGGLLYVEKLEGKNVAFKKFFFYFFFFALEQLLLFLEKWIFYRFYFYFIVNIFLLTLNFLIVICRYLLKFGIGLYFIFFHPILFYRAYLFFKYKNEEFIHRFFSLIEEVIDSTYDTIYFFFDHKFAEYEEDILYGAPKAERELWVYTSYEYLAVKKKLTERFSSLLEKIIWEKGFKYNYFFWFPFLNRDLLKARLKKARLEAAIARENKIQRIALYWQELDKDESEVISTSFCFNLILVLLPLFFIEYLVNKVIPDFFPLFLQLEQKIILLYKICEETIISIFAWVNYFFWVWIPTLFYDTFVLFIGLPLRIIFLFFSAFFYTISTQMNLSFFHSGFFSVVFKKGLFARFLFFVQGSLHHLYEQYEKIVQNYPLGSKSIFFEDTLDDSDSSLFLKLTYEFYMDSFEWVVTEELDEALIDILQKYAKYVYIKRFFLNFFSSFFSSFYMVFFQNIYFLNKFYFLVSPFLIFVSFVCQIIFSFFWFIFSVVSWGIFLLIRGILYVWFDLGTRISYRFYSYSWFLAEQAVKDGKLTFSLVLQYIIPFITDMIKLLIKSVLVFFAFWLLWLLLGPEIMWFVKTTPKWFKHYIMLLYFGYFLAGGFLAILSRKCYEAYLEGLDFVIENFIFIFFSINILNFLMVPPWYFRGVRQDAQRWRYRWRNKKNRLPFSYREYFDKGAWQLYTDRRYVPKYLWECLENHKLYPKK